MSRPICDDWVRAAQNAGYRFNPDHNGAAQEGVGYFQLTARKGRRCSSAVAYLRPARKRRNLRVITHALVQRIVIEDGRARGVVYQRPDGDALLVRARREVVLSAGTINSPQILMLSGIGAGDQLRRHGIDVVNDLPGVGQNLQDHLQARLVFKCREPTMNDEVNSYWKQLKIGVNYLLFRSGPMTAAASLAAGFLKTDDRLETPDIQFHIQPWSDGRSRSTNRAPNRAARHRSWPPAEFCVEAA